MKDKNDLQITKLLNIDKNNYLSEVEFEKGFDSSEDNDEFDQAEFEFHAQRKKMIEKSLKE